MSILDRAIRIPFKMVGMLQKIHEEYFWWIKRKRQYIASWLYTRIR